MSMKKDIGIGVIGIGMGSTMFPLNGIPGSRFQVRGICSVDEGKMKELDAKWGFGFITTDYRELIRRKDVHVVAVYSPDHLHFEHASAALKAGKHVVCTKPLTNNIEHAKELVRLVRETGLKFLVGQTMRYDPQFCAAKRFFDDGEIGRIIFAEAHYVHDLRPIFEMTPWRLEAPQDFMYGGVCHPVDILRWYLGDIEELHAYGCKGGLTPEFPLMDNFTLNVKFKNGVIGRILGIYGVIEPPEHMMKVVLYGSKMNVKAEFSDNKGGLVSVVWDKVEYRPEAKMEFPPEHGVDVYGHTKTVLRYMKHFEECVTKGVEPVPSVVDGAKTIAVGHAAWQSIKEGRVVKVFNEF
jgi:predicted dehydrogenase